MSASASEEGLTGFPWSLASLGSWAHVKGPRALFQVPLERELLWWPPLSSYRELPVSGFRVFLLSLGPNVDWLRTYRKITLGFRDLLGKLLKILFVVKVTGVADNMGLGVRSLRSIGKAPS